MAIPNQENLNQDHGSPNWDRSGRISCTTFNILAPIYKRVNGESCESEFRETWISRNESILDRLLSLKSSIICLQEFWVRNEEFVKMYEMRLSDAGYVTYKLARTNNRGDGLLTALHQNQFHVVNYKELLFNDFGDRVAQILHVELLAYFPRCQALVVNTHLLFPHDSSYCFRRLKQVYRILQYIESYFDEYQLSPVPIILCGDWNGSNKGNVYKFLLSQGFLSSYDMAHQNTDTKQDSHKWVSHRNHRGNICGVDFIWLLNPRRIRKPLKESFTEAVLGNITTLLHKASREGVDIQQFLGDDDRHITYSQFSQILTELGLCDDPHDGLRDVDMKELWAEIDNDGDGLFDNAELSFHQKEEDSKENRAETDSDVGPSTAACMIGFDVKRATLFPPEVENGTWPDYYSLSDHAQLTVEFSPVKF